MAERRRLPVIQSPPSPSPSGDDGAPDPDAIEARPPWHWIGFGTVAIFAAWLPLTFLAQGVADRLVARRFPGVPSDEVAAHVAALPPEEYWRIAAVVVALQVSALAGASLGGGYLVGRFGSGSSLREPIASGAVTALVALLLAVRWTGSFAGTLAQAAPPVVVAVGFAALGGRLGLRRRASPPSDGGAA